MNPKGGIGLFLGAIFLLLFVLLVSPGTLMLPAAAPVSPAVGAVLWDSRTYEALLQGMIILAGVLSILLLLGLTRSGGIPP